MINGFHARVKISSLVLLVVLALFAVGVSNTFAEDENVVEVVTEQSAEVLVSDTYEDLTGSTEVEEVLTETTEEIPVTDVTTDSEAEVIEESVDTESEVTEEEPSNVENDAEVAQAPLITTDKDDYQPGETVTMFGRFFSPVKSFFVRIFGNSEVGNFWSDTTHEVTSDEEGSWSLSQTFDNFYRPIYNVIVSDEEGEVVATSSFTDAAGAAVVVFDQCANDDGDGYNGNPGDCLWTNGNMNTNNSTISEEDSTVQRLVLDGLTNGSHVVTLEYQTTKGGKNAYDFLTDFNQSETWVNQAKLCAGDATTKFPSCGSATASFSPNIPHDPLNVNGTDDTNQNIMILNGTITAISTPVKVSGTYAADSLTQINVTFTVNTNTCLNKDTQGNTVSCPVFMAWGAHVSSQADWGVGKSAVNISGSPYHMKVVALDGGSTGNRDNQMSAAALVVAPAPGSITIIKDAVPNHAQNFAFTTTGVGLNNFSLDDDSDNTLSNTVVFNGLDVGTYTVTEGAIAGWNLTNLVCVDPTTNSTVNLGTRTATINVGDGENITCTYTNTLQTGTIVVDKITIPSGDTQSFSFTAGGTGYSNFALTDAAAPNSQVVTVGTYSIAETIPAGWTQTSALCDNGETIEDITVGAGETITCTFTNTKKGHIIVDKVTVPALDTQSFSFTAGGAGYSNFALTDAAAVNNQEVVPGAYTVSEGTVAGWVQTSAVCDNGETPASLDVEPGETVTCTFTNTKNGSLTLVKNTVGGNGEFDFDATGAGLPADIDLTTEAGTASQIFTNLDPAVTYTVTETVPAGWDLTSATCDNGEEIGSINIDPGQNVTCTFVNEKDAFIIVDKVTVPGADLTVFDFNPSWSTNDFTLTDAGTPVNSGDLAPGSYNVSELAEGGWDLTNTSCVSSNGDAETAGTISLQAGETVTCTFTNTKRGSITIEKQTLPNADLATFTFTGDVAGVLGDGQTATQSVAPGTYSSTEVTKAGWDLTNITCDDANSSGVVGTGVATFNVAAGENVKCTFTNTKRAHIIIVKDVIGNPDPTDFTFNNNFGNGNPATFLLDEDTNATLPSSRDFEVLPGTYAVSEDALLGWQSPESTSCTNDETVGSIDVAPGETVTCTFVNEELAKIILIKNTIGGNGDFDFDATGVGLPADIDLTTVAETASQTFENLDQDNTYSIAESAQAGWDLTSAVCTGGNTPASINPDAGETVTCTFTNTKRGALAIVKNTIGGDASFDFDATGAGLAADIDLTTVAGTASQTFSNLNPANTYTVAESAQAEWDLTSATCDNGETIGDIQVDPGQTVTCTFTNVKRGHIIVDKITNPAGDSESFSFTTDAGSNFALTDAAAPHDSGAVVPGTYSVAETVPTGWDLTSATCSDGSPVGAISLQAGETVTCTFNNEKDAYIIVDKVTNPIGDDTEFEFNPSWSADNFMLADEGTPVNSGDLTPGTYSVAELAETGWDLTNTSCVSSNEDVETAGTISLQAGETVTCTFTNSKLPTLTLVKTVINNNGGTLTTSDFQGKINGNNVPWTTIQTLAPGAYTASETTQAGYAASVWATDCAANGTVSLAYGDNKTCSIVNDDIAPLLHLRKIVVNDNGGTSTVSDFTLTANGTGANDISGTSPVDSGATLMADTWTLSETNMPGYTSSTWSCVGGTQEGASITVGIGGEATCTITNDDQPGHLIVTKVTNPTDTTAVFSITASGGTIVSPAATQNISDGAPVDYTVFNGTYSVAETPLTGWDETANTCVGVKVNNGETKNCQITNTKRGKIIVQKIVDGNTETQFTFAASYDNDGFVLTGGQNNDSGLIIPGTYSASETVPAGWDQTSATCSDQSPVGAISLQPGETVTCTFTNVERGHIIVDKVTNPAGDTQSFSFTAGGVGYTNFALTDAMAPNNQEVVPGTYSVSEGALANWIQTSAVCDNGETIEDITVGAGETVTCTFTNTKKANLTIVKDAQANDCQDFSFAMTGQSSFFLDDDAGVQDCLGTNQNQSKSFANLTPGSVTVTETQPNSYWTLKGATCVVTGSTTPFASILNGNALMVNLTPGADVTCTFVNEKLSPTRTQGFWQTHTAYTTSIFQTNLASAMPIGSAPHKGVITTTGQLFGGFYSSIPKTSTGAKRTELDKARMQLLQQLIAAKLNCAAFGCAASVQTMIANADAAFAGTSVSAILTSAGLMDAYNNSGDTIIIGSAGKATPKDSQALANKLFWDLP